MPSNTGRTRKDHLWWARTRYGEVKIMARLKSPEELEKFRQELLSKRDPSKPCISICAGAGCIASGADEIIAAFEIEIEKQGLTANVDTKGTGCPGFCERGPVVVIYPEEICYLGVTADDVPDIVSQTIKENKVVDRLLFVDPITGEKPFMKPIYHFIRIKKERFSAITFELILKALMTTLLLVVILH